MRTSFKSSIPSADFRKQLLVWAQQFREVVFLDSNRFAHLHSEYDCILAVDALTSIKTDTHNAFDNLKQYQQTTQDWLFGSLAYDLKNDTESLESSNFDALHFPELFFFQPKRLFLFKGDNFEMHYLKLCDEEIESDLAEIASIKPNKKEAVTQCSISQRISESDYHNKVSQMLQHIQQGDIYEANFCIEFYATDAVIDPQSVYQKLNSISEPPFAAFLKIDKQYALSASPERYLKKIGQKLISQPIKGTARRSSDPEQDRVIRQNLIDSKKERSENIMIVDLVRNDLSKTAAKGSVSVTELCGAYTFRQVHHLISTIESEIDSQYSPIDVLRTTFPMGSMTGAPKISAMQIIEMLEETKRGLYSGSVGYFTPSGDFDFNVVIRSILYNATNHYLSFSVGSAITSESTPESEYAECLVKAAAMFEVLKP